MTYRDQHDIVFENINNSLLAIGSKIAASYYQKDENDNITFNLPIINAIDIDWNNVYISDEVGNANTSGDIVYSVKLALEKCSDLYNQLANDEVTIAAAGDKLAQLEEAINNLNNIDLSDYATLEYVNEQLNSINDQLANINQTPGIQGALFRCSRSLLCP